MAGVAAPAPAASRVSALLKDLPRHRAAPPTLGNIATAKPVQRDQANNRVYIATHEFTQPPATQIVTTERQNILLRAFHARADKRAQKRASSGDAPSLVEPAPKRAARANSAGRSRAE